MAKKQSELPKFDGDKTLTEERKKIESDVLGEVDDSVVGKFKKSVLENPDAAVILTIILCMLVPILILFYMYTFELLFVIGVFVLLKFDDKI
jgi:hypothetical protein